MQAQHHIGLDVKGVEFIRRQMARDQLQAGIAGAAFGQLGGGLRKLPGTAQLEHQPRRHAAAGGEGGQKGLDHPIGILAGAGAPEIEGKQHREGQTTSCEATAAQIGTLLGQPISSPPVDQMGQGRDRHWAALPQGRSAERRRAPQLVESAEPRLPAIREGLQLPGPIADAQRSLQLQLGRQAVGLAQNIGVGVEQIDRSREDWFGRSLDRGSAGMAGQRQIAQLHREPGGA